MIRFLKLTILLFFYFKTLYANENISKLNSLYLEGILNDETYFNSLNNLGIDTNNNNFNNLFDLFKNNVLDQKSYLDSLSNLLSDDIKKQSKTDNEGDKNHLNIIASNKSIFKEYKFTNCKGNSDTCNQIKSEIIPFKFSDDKVQLTQEWLEDLIKREPSFTSIANIKTFKKKKEVDIIVSILHVKGLMLNFVFSGHIEKNDFHMEDFKVKVGGTEEASANLSLI